MGATAPIPSRATEGERVQSPGKEHACDQEQPLRGEGDGEHSTVALRTRTTTPIIASAWLI